MQTPMVTEISRQSYVNPPEGAARDAGAPRARVPIVSPRGRREARVAARRRKRSAVDPGELLGDAHGLVASVALESVCVIVICAPPGISSTLVRTARIRTREFTGSGAGKRTRL